MRVFLGGTCTGWAWRDELQPLLKCDYYNPVVEDWTEEDRLRELHEREVDDFMLYCITNDLAGVYSIAEALDDSNKRPEKTLFLDLYKEDGTTRSKQMKKSLVATARLLEYNGARVFNSLEEVAEFLNSKAEELK